MNRTSTSSVRSVSVDEFFGPILWTISATLLALLVAAMYECQRQWARRNASEDQAGARDSEEAERELEKVDLKLQGIDQMRSPTPRSVDGQVASLINQATDINQLCQMYLWWMPWC